VTHFAKMRHQVVPYAWRILAKRATPKSFFKKSSSALGKRKDREKEGAKI